MRPTYRASSPLLPIAVHREQLECGDHRSSLCLGCTSSLPPHVRLAWADVGVEWELAICDYGLLCSKESGDPAQIGEDIQGLQAFEQRGCASGTLRFPAISRS